MWIYYFSGIILLPGFLLALYAQYKVMSVYSKYSKVQSKNGVTASEFARFALNRMGMNDVSVGQTGGHLTDHYDPRSKTVTLSSQIHDSSSISALSIAAHEVGHAEQYAQNYSPIKVRTALIYTVNITSRIMWPLVIIGIIFSIAAPAFYILGMPFGEFLMYLGLAFYSLTMVLSLVTLPTELNASKRAIRILSEGGIITSDEAPKCKEVLSAAAFTYLASLVISFLEILRLLLIISSFKRD